MDPKDLIVLPKRWATKARSAGAEPAVAGAAEADRAGGLEGGSSTPKTVQSTSSTGRGDARHSSGRRYTPAERLALLQQLDASGLTVAEFARTVEVSSSTLYGWTRGRTNARQVKRTNKRGRHYTPEERRATVEAFERSGLSQVAFAKVWGVSPHTLRNWLYRKIEGGPKALENALPRPGDKRLVRKVPAPTIEAIEDTKRRFPSFGLRKVRDWVARFGGAERVSLGTVKRTLVEAGLDAPAAPPPRPKRKKKQPPRRFERAKPGQLWQSDITSFHLPRDSRRVYLVVFLDDRSRFIVSWNLACHHKAVFVTDALTDGLGRFGRPDEVLTDQGRQYFAWRGKSAFTKLLEREGIKHVVSRAHHPQTLGKCERLWQTVKDEFWDRAKPTDLGDARARFADWVSHYNFFRPHQGLDGLVPADRFFEAEESVREALVAKLPRDPLARALDAQKRQRVYLSGRVGDRQVALSGERGRVVVHLPEGEQELCLDELGAGVAADGRPVAPGEEVRETEGPDRAPQRGDDDEGRTEEFERFGAGLDEPGHEHAGGFGAGL